MATYFTADLHLGHENILRYCGRPFTSLKVMELELVENWNRRVKTGDVVWILGDFAYRCNRGHAQAILDGLNGEKHLVCGGHDYKIARLLAGWTSVGELITLRDPGESPIVMCHYPLLSWWNARRGAYMLHGHRHARRGEAVDRRRVDVGVDAWDYAPVSWEEIVKACQKT